MSIKNMLVDATQPEETRVAVVSQNNLLQDFDFESTTIRQLKGNIYLAKVTRVEPSLQAAFLEYGGNRQGFLPFSEIHPDYFRIPIADREKLIERERELLEQEELEEEKRAAAEAEADAAREKDSSEDDEDEAEENDTEEDEDDSEDDSEDEAAEEENDTEETDAEEASAEDESEEDENENDSDEEAPAKKAVKAAKSDEAEDSVEQEADESKPKFRVNHRQYKIQEVVKPRQIMLVQISKEERGNKGAAITTYISLPGRYCVLMPNSSHGGGVSRKVGNPAERRKMKKILEGLGVPDGMSVILRTAGLDRTKVEIKRDLDYLLRLWNSIREKTLESTAPALVYEEGNLIKRSIRDLYDNDIDEVIVAGKEGYKEAKDFMKMLMPSHAKKVKEYKDEKVPLFQQYVVEKQIDDIFSTSAHMKSGGYIVINPTEALVSIDVNSGRSTKERHIEETALQTNLEAAEEVARQLRLRDLGGLVVVDFIDMESYRHNRLVEKRLKECLEKDRARVQVGRISNFGLLELSRQRLRPSLFETNFHTCAACTGIGRVRTVESSALMILRAIESYSIEQAKDKTKKDKDKTVQNIFVKAHTDVSLYILNQKRDLLASIESNHSVRVFVNADKDLITGSYSIVKADGTEIKSVDTNQNSQDAGHEHKPKRQHQHQHNHDRGERQERPDRNNDRNNQEQRHQGQQNNQHRNAVEGEEGDEGSKRRRKRGRRGGRRRNQRGPQDGTENQVNADGTPNTQNVNGQNPNQQHNNQQRHEHRQNPRPENVQGNVAEGQEASPNGNVLPDGEKRDGEGKRFKRNRRRKGPRPNGDNPQREGQSATGNQSPSGENTKTPSEPRGEPRNEHRSESIIIPIEDNSSRASSTNDNAENESKGSDKPRTPSSNANSTKRKGWWKRLQNKDGE